MVVADNQITYSYPLQQFSEKLISLYHHALTLLQNIPTLEREIMESLIWTHTPILASVHHMEDGVKRIDNRIIKAMERSIQPLRDYLSVFESYKELLASNVDDYIKRFKEAKHPLEYYRQEISMHLQKQEEIDMSIPEAISMGMFFVNASSVRNFLSNKRRTLAYGSIYSLNNSHAISFELTCGEGKKYCRQNQLGLHSN